MRKISFLFLLCLLFLNSLAFSTKIDNIELRKKLNKPFLVTIESNPTTGYQWQIESIIPKNSIKLLRSTYIPSKTNLVGAGGFQEFLLLPNKKGVYKVRLKYIRPWEKDIPPVFVKEYKIYVY